jgi:hypothetical protein
MTAGAILPLALLLSAATAGIQTAAAWASASLLLAEKTHTAPLVQMLRRLGRCWRC